MFVWVLRILQNPIKLPAKKSFLINLHQKLKVLVWASMSCDDSATTLSPTKQRSNALINFKQGFVDLTTDFFDKVFAKSPLRLWSWLWMWKRNQMEIHTSKYQMKKEKVITGKTDMFFFFSKRHFQSVY